MNATSKSRVGLQLRNGSRHYVCMPVSKYYGSKYPPPTGNVACDSYVYLESRVRLLLPHGTGERYCCNTRIKPGIYII